jgi:hypothetical protein
LPVNSLIFCDSDFEMSFEILQEGLACGDYSVRKAEQIVSLNR